ncbi:MAG: 30S ribosomal protein S4 [Candidatus Woesearchaeota archaeon]
MGNSKRLRKKYITPMHPWQKARLEEELLLKREYGLKNKTEIMRQSTIIKNMIENFKKTTTTPQAKKEKELLIAKMVRLGLIEAGADSDRILGLHVRDVLERRLQTLVYKKRLANSMKQARQYIVHRHITVGDKVITSPSYIVSVAEQANIGFITRSSLCDETHPERVAAYQEKHKKEEKQEEVVEQTAPKQETVKETSEQVTKEDAS